MSKKINKLIAIKLILYSLMINSIENSNLECLIESVKHPNEFLYVEMTSVKGNEQDDPNVYAVVSVSVKDLDRIKWSLIQLNDQESNGYLLKNSRNGEYLCGSNDINFKGIFKKRSIYTSSFDPTNAPNECKWIIDRSVSDSNSYNSYIIWNMHFGEALYASTTFLTKNRRQVYLLNQKPDSDYFKWTLDC